MTRFTKAQALRYNAIFEDQKAMQRSTTGFKNELKHIFGTDIFPYFLHSHDRSWHLSDYFKNLILLTKFLTCLALEKEDDSSFHSFYQKIATACVTLLKNSYPEQKKEEGLIYTPEFEDLLHDAFFCSLCIRPGEMDRINTLFSTKCAIIGSTILIAAYEGFEKNFQHFAKSPSRSRLPPRPSQAIVTAIEAYRAKIEELIQKILVAQSIDLDLNAITTRLRRLAHRTSRTAATKIALAQTKEQAAMLGIFSFGIIATAFTLYQTGGDLGYTALTLLLSILLLGICVSLNNPFEKRMGQVSSQTREIKFDLERQQEELATQGSLEKQTYETIKPSPFGILSKKEEKDEEYVINYPEYFFGFSGLQPTQIQIRKMRSSSSTAPKNSSFFPIASPLVKEVLPPHYNRDSSGRLVFFNPDDVALIGKSEPSITPQKFSASTYFVHKKSLSDNLKGCGINHEITFKLKPKARSNVRAYGIAETQTINGNLEEVCIVTHFLSKAH